MTKLLPLIGALSLAGLISACATAPEPEPVVVEAPVIEQTCVSMSLLTRQVIPAVTKSGTSITAIENPVEYIYNEKTGKVDEYQAPPIERKETWTKIIKPEEVIYVNAEGQQVTDICELKPQETTEIGPNAQIGTLPPPPEPN